MKFIILLIFTLHSAQIYADEACSRIAIINQQEVLVDPSSSLRGEGLRFQLEKDAKARFYLDKYQSVSADYIRPAVLGTLGTGLILSTFIINTSKSNKKALLISGVATLLINFLITKTIDTTNEKYLKQSIDEYNKRRLPKIYLRKNREEQDPKGIFINKSWIF